MGRGGSRVRGRFVLVDPRDVVGWRWCEMTTDEGKSREMLNGCIVYPRR